MSSRRLAAAVFCAVVTLTCAQTAHALDAFWHGVRSDVWSDGIAGGISNWYSQAPPDGVARAVPGGTATFAPGAMRFNLRITQNASVARMIFTSDAPLYTFRIARNRRLDLTGLGLFNRSSLTPKFTILGGAAMNLTGGARLAAVGAGTAAHIVNLDSGRLNFKDSSRGGNAVLENVDDSVTEFSDSSSAEDMEITNSSGGIIFFRDRASGGKAHIINGDGGSIVNVSQGQGPNGDFEIPLGQIENDEFLFVGNRTLQVARSFTQGAGGELVLAITTGRFGKIETTLNAKVGGTLTVAVPTNPTPGSYKVIKAGGKLSGRFSQLKVSLPATLKARLAYSGKEVTLIIEKNERSPLNFFSPGRLSH